MGQDLRARTVEDIQMRSIRRHAERTFERELEQVLRVSFRQPDQRIGNDQFIQRVRHRGDTGLDDANGKALGNAVDLLPKSGLKPLAGKPDLDEWPLASRQIWLEIHRRQVIAKVGQTHIAGLWEAKKGDGPPDRDVFRHDLRPRRGSPGSPHAGMAAPWRTTE